ncbi:DUF948 domain-containing protein [Bacillaceae bacterium S4-13-58]
MIDLLYIAALIVAIAFAILVFFIGRTLKSAQKTLSQVANTLDGLEKQLEGISIETTSLLNKTNLLAEDIQEKSQKLNSVVDGVQGVGTTIQQFNQSLRSISGDIHDAANQNKENVVQAMQWGNVALDLWKKFKRTNKRMEDYDGRSEQIK